MKFCLDTSAVIEVLYATNKGKEIQEITKEKSVVITVFTIHELFTGMKNKESDIMELFLDRVSVIDYTKECAIHSAVIEKHLRKKGTLVNKMDILIAGTCLHRNYHLITCDADFEKIKGIQATII